MNEDAAGSQDAQGGSSGLSIDLTYIAEEDRVRMTLRKVGADSVDWWWTRRMTLPVLRVWVDKLDEVPLPALTSVPWMPSPQGRDLAQEHALSLEFDGPRSHPVARQGAAQSYLPTTIKLNVSSTDCVLEMLAGQVSTRLTFTRRETHAMLEALTLHARKAGWLEAVKLPEWLGVG